MLFECGTAYSGIFGGEEARETAIVKSFSSGHVTHAEQIMLVVLSVGGKVSHWKDSIHEAPVT